MLLFQEIKGGWQLLASLYLSVFLNFCLVVSEKHENKVRLCVGRCPWIWRILKYLILVGVRVLQRNRNNVIWIKIYLLWRIGLCSYGGWEVPWSASASWRTRKVYGVIQCASQSLRTRSVDVWGWKKGMFQLKHRANALFLHCCFCSGPHRIGWCPWHGWRSLICSVCCFKCQCLLEKPSQTHPEKMFTSYVGIP